MGRLDLPDPPRDEDEWEGPRVWSTPEAEANPALKVTVEGIEGELQGVVYLASGERMEVEAR